MKLTIGPLRYELVAHDDWGAHALSRLCASVDCVGFSGHATRTVHVLDFELTTDERWQIKDGVLPERLAELLPCEAPRLGWVHPGDSTGHICWFHAEVGHSLWTHNAAWENHKAPYQLPWYAILEDIIRRGGGIFHGGLASREDSACLVTAPPDGGKTTALARLSPPWKTISDDAALLWPRGDGRYLCSPLPTWSAVLGVTEALPGLEPWRVATAYKVGGTIVLEKASFERLTRVSPQAALEHIYRAFSEHPGVVSVREYFRRSLFNMACDLATHTPTWKLELTRMGDYWSLLEGIFSDAGRKD